MQGTLDKYSTYSHISHAPDDVMHTIGHMLSYTDSSAFAGTSVGTYTTFLTQEKFERRIWSCKTPIEAQQRAQSINDKYYKNYRHPIENVEAAQWDTVEFCNEAFLLRDQDGGKLLAWARANGCPWSPRVSNNITTIIVPDGVEVLQNDAFLDCARLESISLPASITSLGNYTFKGCTALKSIRLPDSIKFLGTGTFDRCDNLQYVQISEYLIATLLGFKGRPQVHVQTGRVSYHSMPSEVRRIVRSYMEPSDQRALAAVSGPDMEDMLRDKLGINAWVELQR